MKLFSYLMATAMIVFTLSCDKDNDDPNDDPALSFSPQTGLLGNEVTITLNKDTVNNDWQTPPPVVLFGSDTARWVQRRDNKTIYIPNIPGSSIGKRSVTIIDGNKTITGQYTVEEKSKLFARTDYPGGPRYAGISFTIGTKAYVGLGTDAIFDYEIIGPGAHDNSSGGPKVDFYSYDPATGAWSKLADFPGVPRDHAAAFSIGNKGYVIGGNGTTQLADVWEYDAAANQWTQLANFPSTARSSGVGFSIGSKGYISTGRGPSADLNDCWEFDPATGGWTKKADFPGQARSGAFVFTTGGKAFVGTGFGNYTDLVDMYAFDPAANSWTKKSDFSIQFQSYTDKNGRSGAIAFAQGNKGYVGMGITDLPYGGFRSDLWEYDPAGNTFTRLNNSALNTQAAFAFTINEKSFIMGGLLKNPCGSHCRSDTARAQLYEFVRIHN